ncbi:unnamed protein product [Chrysoparadoxa australica]
MSLFQAREWWSTKAGDGEEEFVALAAGNIDNHPDDDAKLAVGSLQGVLRIYYPRQKEFRLEDLVLEQMMGAPILQLEVGRFVPASPDMQALAVLHPRKLAVYTLEPMSNGVTEGKEASYHTLSRCYETPLGVGGDHFTAYNMTYGPFGGVKRDLIAVQSMDGRLQVMEQDAHAFTRRLDRVLLPGPLIYVARIDSFLVCNSEEAIDCYKYSVLATSQLENGGRGQSKKPAQVDWSTKLGEPVLDILVSRFSRSLGPNNVDIVVVTDQSLFTLREQGSLRLQKRLSYSPSAVCRYTVKARDLSMVGQEHPQEMLSHGVGEENLIIGADTSQIMVYKDLELAWAARMEGVPVAMLVCRAASQAGLVCTLADSGQLSLSYMGTDPLTQAVVSSDAREMNYEEIDAEHKELLKVIRHAQSGKQAMSDHLSLFIRAQVLGMGGDEEGLIGMDSGAHIAMYEGDPVEASVRVFLSCTGSGTIRDAVLVLALPDWLCAKETSVPLPAIHGGAPTPLVVPMVLQARSDLLPTTLQVTATVVYKLETGEHRSATTQFLVPLAMACRVVPPNQEDTFKVTLETNKESVLLTQLFEDMDANTPEGDQGVVSFEFWGQDSEVERTAVASVVCSKSAGRYRIQGSSMAAVSLLSQEMATRLHKKFGEASGRPLVLSCAEPLPLQELFMYIDTHFERRKQLRQALAQLNDEAQQLRVIQKRLLTRFKEKNPTPLGHLDKVMQETYHRLLDFGTEAEGAQIALRRARNDLHCGVLLIALVSQWRFDLSDEDHSSLCSHLCHQDAAASAEQGWEERADAALTHLLRTTLASTARETDPGAGLSQTLVMPADTSKLKKHMTIVFDRLSKGARPCFVKQV